MPKKAATIQKWQCSHCKYLLESPIRAQGAWCPQENCRNKKTKQAAPMTLVWDRRTAPSEEVEA